MRMLHQLFHLLKIKLNVVVSESPLAPGCLWLISWLSQRAPVRAWPQGACQLHLSTLSLFLFSTASLAFHSSNSSAGWGLKAAKASMKRGAIVKWCPPAPQPPHLSPLMWLVQVSQGSQAPFLISLLPYTVQGLWATFPWQLLAAPAPSHLHLYEPFLPTSPPQLAGKKGHHFTSLPTKLALRVYSSKCLCEQQPSCCHRSGAQQLVGNHNQKQP